MRFAWVAGVELALEDMLNALLSRRMASCVRCALSVFVGLKGQCFDLVKDLLLCCCSCCVTSFPHGCLLGFLDLWDWAGAICSCWLRILGIWWNTAEPTWGCDGDGGFQCLVSVQFELDFHCLGQWGIAVTDEISIRLGKRWQQTSYSWSIRLIYWWLDSAATLHLLILGSEVCPWYLRDLA